LSTVKKLQSCLICSFFVWLFISYSCCHESIGLPKRCRLPWCGHTWNLFKVSHGWLHHW